MQQFFDTLSDTSGRALSGAQLQVLNWPAMTAAAIYATNSTAAPIANSTVTADNTGQVSCYIPDGAYAMVYKYQGATYKTRAPVQILDPMAFVAAQDVGTLNALVVNDSRYPTALFAGMKIEVKVSATNTGAATLNLNSTGTKSITTTGLSSVAASMLTAGGYARLEYDGTQWQLLGSQSQPVYDQTTAEANVSVVPLFKNFPSGNPRRQGAPIDGVTSARAALFTQNSTAEQIYLTRGTYLVDSNLTISSAVWCEAGAIFKVATGVTLTFTGPFDGSVSQHFQCVGTGAVVFGSAANQWPNVPVKPVCPEYWGAQGVNGIGDDTLAVQACFNAHRAFVFNQHYPVSHVDLIGNELVGDFNNFELRGVAAGGLASVNSVLDLRCGYSVIHNIRVNQNFNRVYACAIQWYTNNLNLYYPGFNRFYGMYVTNAVIGLVIGALPSQANPIPAQGTVQAVGTATDAPLSESEIYGFKSMLCVRPIYMRQPNGKVTLVSPDMRGEVTGWPGGYPTPSECCAYTQANAGSEMTVLGGFLEQVQEATGKLFELTGGNLHVVGTCIEQIVSGYIGTIPSYGTDAKARFEKILNWGVNTTSLPVIQVQDACTGMLTLRDTWIVRPAGNYATGTAAVVKGVSSFGGGYSPNLNFYVDCDGVEFRDCPFNYATAYVPPILGARWRNHLGWINSYNGSNVRTYSQRFSEGRNLLAGQVDLTATLVSAYPQTTNSSSQGWTFAVSSASQSWGKYTTGLPTIEDTTLAAALRLTTIAGGTISATSPKMACDPQRAYLLRGLISAAAGVNANFIARALFYKFDGSACSTASQDFISCYNSVLGSAWQELYGLFKTPSDCTQVALFLYTENAGDVQVANLEVV